MASLSKALVVAGLFGVSAITAADAQSDAAGTRDRRMLLRSTAAVPTAEATLRPIPASASDLTLRGEFATSETAVFLSGAEALRASAFRVSFSNAVSNLPDGSRLSVRINDQAVGDVQLNASSRLGQATFPVPPGLLVPGYNAVRFVASQRHRVDCSVNATYELWTEISPTQTGFLNIPVTPQPRRLGDLAMLSGVAAGQTPIRIRTSDAVSAAALDQAMRAANAIILAAAITHPQIEVSSEPGTGPGIDLIVGDQGAGPQGTKFESELGLYYATDAGGERSIISIQDSPSASIDATLERIEAFASQRLRPGSKAGQRAVANGIGRRVASDTSLNFAELGMDSRPFDGHLLELKSRFTLPPDFFPAHYGAARLSLNSGFVGEAASTRRITIRVNDQIAAIVPIVKPGQVGLDTRTIELPLRSFKPGANVVSLEANLADAEAACDASQPARNLARLVIAPDSRLSFGKLARVASYPNLSATLSHGFPYSDGRVPMAVNVSNQDTAYLNGAMTWVGRMVASAQMPIATAFRFGPADTAGVSGMFFGAPSEAPTPIELPGTPVASGSGLVVTAANAQQTRAAVASDDATSLFETPSPVAGQGGSLFGSIQSASEALDLSGVVNSVRRFASGDFSKVTASLQDFGLLERSVPTSTLGVESAEGGLLLRQTVQSVHGGASLRGFFSTEKPVVQTFVLASDPTKYAELIEKATRDQNWSRFSGNAAVLRMEDWGPQNGFSQERIYVATSDVSPGNLRLVAAGWLSLNQGYYLLTLAGLVIFLALATALVLQTRRA
jgi:hypothetical protein